MKYLLSIGLFVLMVLMTPRVSAQEVEPESPPPSDGIFEQESLRPEIERLRVSYRGLIEDYRNKERQYQIAKVDYQQLNTLRSLEEAVKATREVIVARTDVLLTYFELLKLELQESEGIELQKKTEALSAIESEIIYLREFRTTAMNAQDKDAVLALTPLFEERVKTLESTGYFSLSLITIGRLQAVHDKSRIIQSDIERYLFQQEANVITRMQRERAVAQATSALEDVNVILNNEVTELEVRESKSSYNSVRNRMNGIYSKLSLSIGYLKELLSL